MAAAQFDVATHLWLTNGFSKKIENHVRDCASLHVLQLLSCASNTKGNPTMEAGVTEHIRGLEEVTLLDLRFAFAVTSGLPAVILIGSLGGTRVY